MAIKALTRRIPHDQVAVLFGVNEDSVSRWVRRFSERGIDGITEGPRSGRPAKIKAERTSECRELILHPEHAKENHWKGRKFHGYLATNCQMEAVYSTHMRLIHDEGFRLKVPRPWPINRDEDRRKAFVERIRKWLSDLGIDLWFMDECGIKGDPRPRRRFCNQRREDTSAV
ncbi:MAG: helix-turn-helix domain-containing protein [Desulfomonilaceae bacterium]